MKRHFSQILLSFLLLGYYFFSSCSLYGSTYTVTSTADGTITDGVSLRWAITQANAHAGADLINFNMGPGVSAIMLATALPDLTDDSTTIDGFNNGASPGTANSRSVQNLSPSTPMNATYRIMLYNSTASIDKALVLTGNYNTIKGLIIPNFGDGSLSNNDAELLISGNNNKIQGCYIGMLPDGISKGSLNTATGIIITGSNNSIGNGLASGANLISGMNSFYGIQITGTGAIANTIKGNVIGLQKDGSSAISGVNQNYGIFISNGSSGNLIGGSGASSEINIISGNAVSGIFFSFASGNFVQNNIIGPKADGSMLTPGLQNEGISISNSGNNTIGGNYFTARNIISANLQYGITIKGAASTENTITGNYIGIHKNGTTIVTGSVQYIGVFIDSLASGNTVGGTVSGEGNVISGNLNSGIFISSQATAGNTIIGNIIGTQSGGLLNLAGNIQRYGIYINNSVNNTIGRNSATERNYISANLEDGIYISGNGATGNLIKGNYIGTNKNGTGIVTGSSQDHGIYIDSLASLNSITDGNVISANTVSGIRLSSLNSAGNTVSGNLIGCSNTGGGIINNTQPCGIWIDNSPNNLIGGSTSPEGNTISYNLTSSATDKGIYINGVNASGNSIKGNYIRLQDYGIYVTTSSSANIFGGGVAGEGNVISGNSSCGIYFKDCSAANIVKGNIIGLLANGIDPSVDLQYTGLGIINSRNIIVGGTSAAERNIISGNGASGISAPGSSGILISGTNSTSISIKGNYIGPAINGTNAIASIRQNFGIIIDSAFNIEVGGLAPGEGNLISGNGGGNNDAAGIFIKHNANNITITGNVIGPQKDSNTFMTNIQFYGISINSARDNKIGNVISSGRNVISANAISGIYIYGAASTGNVIKGNYIGIAGNGLSCITSSIQAYGIELEGAENDTIGGINPGEGNLISGNYAVLTGGEPSGIFLHNNSNHNVIYGNTIGPSKNGTQLTSQQNQDWGIWLNNSPDNIIGGDTPGSRNIISGNRRLIGGAGTERSAGIYLSNSGTERNLIKGNYIGTTPDGMGFITSSYQCYGIHIDNCNNNVIGGLSPGDGNLISGNYVNGIYMENNSRSNKITGNLIGTQKDGQSIIVTSSSFENQDYGISIKDSPYNIIGGNTAAHRNVISGNGMGIFINGGASVLNSIKGNYIGIAADGVSHMSSDIQNTGIWLKACDSTIVGSRLAGEANTIAYNITRGVLVMSDLIVVHGRYNRISGNLIYGNSMFPINNTSGGNDEKTPPVITASYPGMISGTSVAGDTIEIFKNAAGNCLDAAVYVGTTLTDASGHWSFPGTFSLGEKILVDATSPNNNTSELSCSLIECSAIAVTGNTSLCPGDSVILTASGGTDYTWEPGTITGSTATYYLPGTITLFANYNGGCNDTSLITISDLSVAAAGSITGQAVVCAGESGVEYSVPAISNSTAYSWMLPPGATITSGMGTDSITVSFSTLATGGAITVQGSNSCGTGLVSNSFPVTVNPLPDVTTSVSGNNINANLTGAAYQWIDCDNANMLIAGATGQSYVAASDGNYAVIISNNGCTDTSACINITATAIAQPGEQAAAIKIYPNPSGGIFTIELSANTEISITDITGKAVSKEKMTSGVHSIDITGEAKGIYFMHVITEGKSQVIKIVKQ